MKQHIIENSTTQLKDEVIIGIYFLIHKNEIVYVGQSISCYSRIRQHQKEGVKVFDSFFIQPEARENLCEMESESIFNHVPKYNRGFPGDGIFMSPKEIYSLRNTIKNQRVEAMIIGGQVFFHGQMLERTI